MVIKYNFGNLGCRIVDSQKFKKLVMQSFNVNCTIEETYLRTTGMETYGIKEERIGSDS